jgi:hypothetical protein
MLYFFCSLLKKLTLSPTQKTECSELHLNKKIAVNFYIAWLICRVFKQTP